MPITKADLMAALRGLSRDEMRDLGIVEAHPFEPRQANPDRVKRVQGSERWYQLVRGDRAVELHVSDEAGAVLHRYIRGETVAEPAFLLHGFVGVDGMALDTAPELADATDAEIWAALESRLA